jgi:hypothetical protein
MIPRIGRPPEPLKRLPPSRRRAHPWPDRDSGAAPPLALAYSNGYVTVEISQAALDAYVEHNGDVPLPVSQDAETGDRRVYDAENRVRVVYDGDANVREVATRSNDGLFVRINFTDAAGARGNS